MQKITVFSVDYYDETVKTHLGLFSNNDVATQVSKGNGAWNQDADVTPTEIIIFDSIEEFTEQTKQKVLSKEEIEERIKEKILNKLTEEERKILGI